MASDNNAIPGSQPLTKERLENFAQLLSTSTGKSQAEAWQLSGGKEMDARSARNGGSRALKNADTAARVAFLRREHAKELSEASLERISTDPLAIMQMVSDVLKKAYIAAQTEGFPEAKLSMVRKAWSLHVARYAALKKTHKVKNVVTSDASQFFSRLGGCNCQT